MSFISEIKSKLLCETENKNKLVTFINPFSYLELRKKNIVEEMDQIFVDGILLVLMFRLFGIKVNRKSFDMTSLAPIIFEKSVQNNQKIYFVGAKQDEIQKFIVNIQRKFDKLEIIGFRNGYFSSFEERSDVLKKIDFLNPDIVIIGMGTPKQEQFLIDLKKLGWKGTGYTCGGFIHQTAKGINYYPEFFNKFNLRWLYRFVDERRVFIRTVKTYPIFIIIFLFDNFKSRFSKQYLL